MAVPEVEGFTDLELIGKGGQSLVYKARQESFDRAVAIKVLNIEDEAAAKRFTAEQRAMGRLSDHPGVVTVYNTTTTADGLPALVMPLFDNGSMASLLVDGGMDWREAVDLVLEVTETVAAAHELGVIHRDLKPANVLIDGDGRPKIADFGIAKLATDETASQSTSLTFTPVYSPPESFSSSKSAKATDVYGLGATLWALLAGHPPYKKPGEPVDLMVLINRVLNEPLEQPQTDLPSGVAAVLQMSLAKDPASRFADAGSLAAAFKAVLGSPDVVPAAVAAALEADDVTVAREVADTELTVARASRESDAAVPQADEPDVTPKRSRKLLVAALIALLAVGGGAALALLPSGSDPEIAAAAVGDEADTDQDDENDDAGEDGEPSDESGAVQDDGAGTESEDRPGTTARLSGADEDDPLGPAVAPAGGGNKNQPAVTSGGTSVATSSETTMGSTNPTVTVTQQPTVTVTPTVTQRPTVTDTGPPVVTTPRPVISGLSASAVSQTEGLVSFTTNTCTGASYSYSSGSHVAGYPNQNKCWRSHSARIGNPNWSGQSQLQPGTRYTVTVTVTDAEGRTARKSVSFTTDTAPVTQPPAETVSVSLAGVPGTVTCGNQPYSISAPTTGTITDYNWDTGRIQLASAWNSGPGATVVFDLVPGTYTITIYVNNKSASRSASVTVVDDGSGCQGMRS